MVIETMNQFTKLSLHERFTMISEQAEAPRAAPRTNELKPVVDRFIQLSNEIAHLKAEAVKRRMQLQAQQEQLNLLQSGRPLPGTVAAAIPSRMPAYHIKDWRRRVAWANIYRQRGLRVWHHPATPARGQGLHGRGRGGIARQHQRRPMTREQLDAELDQYMSNRAKQ